MNTNSKIKVGLIGTGEMSTFYARAIKHHVPEVCLAAVSSQDASRAKEFARRFEIPKAFGRHVEGFDDLDAVVIASASDTHAPLIEAAARSGLDILCDKPLGTVQQDIDAAISVANDCAVKLATGFNRRFDPAFQDAYRRIAEGEIGTPESMLIVSCDPVSPSVAELTVPYRLYLGTTIHDFDMARFLMRDEVTSLVAHGSWLGDRSAVSASEQVDTSTVTLKFEGGGIATIINSYRSTEGYDQRVELRGSRAMIRIDNVRETMPDVPPDSAFFVKRYAQSYISELRAFFETVKSNDWTAELATAEDGRIASLLAEAAVTSCETETIVRPMR